MIDLIEDLNQNLYNSVIERNSDVEHFLEENPPFEFLSIGYAHRICFFGIQIWSSEDDERPYENEDDPKLCDHIPLKDWLEQESKRILKLFYALEKTVNYPYPKGIGASQEALSSPDSVSRNGYYDRQVMTPSVDAPDRCNCRLWLSRAEG